MIDPASILVQNLIDALRQINTYAALGLATAISAFSLDRRASGGTEEAVPLPGGLGSMGPGPAQVVLMGVCLVTGAMGSYAADAALNITRSLHHDAPELLAASCTFPSVATAPMGIPIIAAAIPVFLIGVIIWRVWSRVRIETRGAENPGGFIMMFGFFVAAYGTLAAAILRLPCRSLS